MRKCRKILWSGTDHRRQCGAYALHAGHLRLQIHTQAFPLQQWLYERASMLRYTYIASLVPEITTGQAAPSRPGSPHCQIFSITLRHTTFDRTTLDE